MTADDSLHVSRCCICGKRIDSGDPDYCDGCLEDMYEETIVLENGHKEELRQDGQES